MYLPKENHLCEKQELLAHCFPVSIAILFERKTSSNLGFSRCRWTLFVPKRSIHLSWSNTCISPKKTIYVRRFRLKHIVSLWELSKFMKRQLPTTYVFQGRHRRSLFQISLFSWVEETNVSLQTKPYTLEAAKSSTLFPCENGVSLWKEYFLHIRVFKVEEGSFCSK
jgi:hypothetical protein